MSSRKLKCTLDNTQLAKSAEAWIDRLINSGGKDWSLPVPANPDKDVDLILSEIVNRFKKQLYIKDDAATIYIDHPEAGYGIFCFNSKGDLFLNSDWGFYGYSWRAFSDSFADFLRRSNAEYIVGKFAINHNQSRQLKNWLTGKRKAHVEALLTEFLKKLNECQSEPATQNPQHHDTN